MKLILTVKFLFVFQFLLAQDSVKTLSEKQVVEIIKRFHPIARIADINIEKAKADITIAKGGFDPVLSFNLDNKTFDGVEYYNYVEPQVTIPTWYGIEVHAGLENIRGNKTDPEQTIGKTSQLGISVPLAKNLLLDKRRAVLQQAKIFSELSAVEKQAVLNDLLLDATTAYWQWVQRYELKNVISNVVTLNERRFELVKIAFRQGERPAIDRVEAFSQLQSFRLLLTEADLAFMNAGLELSTFLWDENAEPTILPSTVIPDKTWKDQTLAVLPLPVLDTILQNAITSHPDLRQYDFHLNALNIERKLKFQELLPSIKFKYNQLGKGYDLVKNTARPLFDDNYKYGISVGIPLRLSEGRGSYRKAKLKVQEKKLEQKQKTNEVENKIRTCYNELRTLRDQLLLQRQQYDALLALQRGEETRFFNGESSLFLINSREAKTLESLQKLTAIETKYCITLNKLYWAGGSLFDR